MRLLAVRGNGTPLQCNCSILAQVIDSVTIKSLGSNEVEIVFYLRDCRMNIRMTLVANDDRQIILLFRFTEKSSLRETCTREGMSAH